MTTKAAGSPFTTTWHRIPTRSSRRSAVDDHVREVARVLARDEGALLRGPAVPVRREVVASRSSARRLRSAAGELDPDAEGGERPVRPAQRAASLDDERRATGRRDATPPGARPPSPSGASPGSGCARARLVRPRRLPASSPSHPGIEVVELTSCASEQRPRARARACVLPAPERPSISTTGRAPDAAARAARSASTQRQWGSRIR